MISNFYVHNLKQKTPDKNGKKQQEKKKPDKLEPTTTKSPNNASRKKPAGRDQVGRQIASPPMHCFSGNTKVYTPTGEKTMKEVSVGDFVSFFFF